MCEIIITRWHGHLSMIGILNNTVQSLDILDSIDRIGNIYVGRVENLVSNLNAAFVRFENIKGKHSVGFLPFKAMPPAHILNRNADSSALKTGDIVLVQLKVEEQKTKQARLSGKIDLDSSTFDGNIDDLIKIAKTRCEYQMISGNTGLVSDEISTFVSDFIKIIDAIDPDANCAESYKIVTDIRDIYDELSAHNVVCEYYDEEEKRLPLQINYSLSSKTDDLFGKKVWLDSGAFLIIEQTETLNLIDVNSGKATKKSEDFFLKLNIEAAIEAYRQIRLRNLSGMILIDFVSMKNADMNERLISFIKNLIQSDPMNLTYIDLTGLGIMEFTRQKRKKSLRETIDIKNK
ncbi:ribonuclease E/G [Butyrivibrio sp. AD3002]|uniref:ribonuclease E/G n=1 Tax=Butyrivibrio sp. AD3002 TaxID=1280670 RepID=UPI0003B2E1D4|nr:ribonuclease E/G [Butyrivibrio sp. AD3002]